MLQHFIILSLVSLSSGTTLDVVLNSPSTQGFYRFAEHCGLLDDLRTGNYTVFAPSDDAFLNVPKSVLVALKNDKPTLKKLLQYHIIPRLVPKNSLANEMMLTALTGVGVRINVHPDKNLTLVQGHKLIDTLPTADNGMVYIINGLMKPPKGTILEILGNNTEYSKFYQFVFKTKLQSLLHQKDANMTVFAWPNSAWKKFTANDMTAGLQLTDLLTDVAKYHMVPHTVYTASFHHGQLLSTLQQTDNLAIQLGKEGIFVNYAKLSLPDTSASNGVVQRVDKILLPPSLLKIAKQFTNVAHDKAAVTKILKGVGL